MSAIHERMLTRYFKHAPGTDASTWGDTAPIDAGMAMILASNGAHLALESRRQLVTDLCQGNASGTGGKGAGLWDGLTDAPAPTLTDLDAADQPYKQVSWAPNVTRRYGPFVGIADRQASDGRYLLRRIKGLVRWSGTGGGTGASLTALHCALTTHPNPTAINQGDLVAYTRQTIAAAGAFSTGAGVIWDAEVPDRPREVIVCRRGAGGAIGPTRVAVTLLWIWVCANVSGNINSVSFWEST